MDKGDDFDQIARDTLRQYLTRQITRAEAEDRLGVQLPAVGEPRPLGEPDAQADWETLLAACISEEERETVQRARDETGMAHRLDPDTARTIVAILDRVNRRKG